MGLFDFLRPKKSETDELGEELVAHFFPGGRDEMLFKGNEVRKISNGRLGIEEAIQVYFRAKKRLALYQSSFNGFDKLGITGDEIVRRAIEDAGGKLSVHEAAGIVHYAIFDKIDPSVETILSVRKNMAAWFGANGVGCDSDEIPNGVGEFGFESSNPIPVRGVLSNKIYLESLRTSDGRKIDFQRSGSWDVSNVVGTVDEYDISQDGQALCKLYINPYNQKISSRPPKGFILVTFHS